jgi:predicted amidohydrolase YtcJ
MINAKVLTRLVLLLFGWWALTPFALAAADAIFINGQVYTVNSQQPWAEAVVVEGHKILYVGDSEQAIRHQSGGTRVIDLEGKMLLPGFIDSHFHPSTAALMLKLGVGMLELNSKEEFLQAVRQYVSENPDVKVVSGFGWSQRAFGLEGPSKEDLDEIVSDRPVLLIERGGHSAWANSRTLDFLNINKDTPDPLPGKHFYVRDAQGNPTGWLQEGAAFWLHLEPLGIGTKEEFRQALLEFLPQLPQVGITSVFDAGTSGLQEFALRALVELDEEGKLPIRYNASNKIITHDDAEQAVRRLERFQKEYSTELVRPMANKIINDGVAPDGGFTLMFEEPELTSIVTNIAVAGQDLMIHVTKDVTVHEALNAMERARAVAGNRKSRFVLTHVDSVRPGDFVRFSEIGVMASIQPRRLGFEWNHEMHEWYKSGPLAGERSRLKTFLDKGVRLTLSSDFPACPGGLSNCTPLQGIEAAHTRQNLGMPDAPVVPPADERLTVEQGIRGYTIDNAYQMRMENELGSIEPGKLADLVVLEENLFEIEEHGIHKVQVLLTMMNGKIVFDVLE